MLYELEQLLILRIDVLPIGEKDTQELCTVHKLKICNLLKISSFRHVYSAVGMYNERVMSVLGVAGFMSLYHRNYCERKLLDIL